MYNVATGLQPSVYGTSLGESSHGGGRVEEELEAHSRVDGLDDEGGES